MLNKEIFLERITMLCEVYNRQQTRGFLNGYYFALQDMQDQDFKTATEYILKNRENTFFPAPAEIISAAPKKQDEVDPVAIEAKRLIDLVGAMNESVYQEHEKTGVPFSDLLKSAKFVSVSEEDIAILDQIKPYYSHKQLVGNINHYSTSKELLNAFIDAIHFSSKSDYTLENKVTNQLKIKR